MRRRPLSKAVVAVVLLVLPASADAPPDQYLSFDRTFTKIEDRFTTLAWTRNVTKTPRTYVDTRALTGTPACPARLPTAKELLTLVDEEPHQEYESSQVVTKMIDRQAFPSTPTDLPYWTLSPASPGKRWAVDFGTGLLVERDETASGYVRCLSK